MPRAIAWRIRGSKGEGLDDFMILHAGNIDLNQRRPSLAHLAVLQEPGGGAPVRAELLPDRHDGGGLGGGNGLIDRYEEFIKNTAFLPLAPLPPEGQR